MTHNLSKDHRVLEIMLIILVLGFTCLCWRMGEYKVIVLNLFYLPIVLSGYYLGRSSAGTLALFSVLGVGIITTLAPAGFAAFSTPTMLYLALTVWAAALGLTALLVGTLCDERAARVNELHEAYSGMVEVLAKYLQSGNTKIKSSSIHTAELSQMVAKEMKLSQQEIDDIRIAVLLYDLGGVEITTRLIRKAVSTLEANPEALAKHTFLGMELVHSLGSVLHSVVPLLVDQDEDIQGQLTMDTEPIPHHMPIGAQIIRVVRAYKVLAAGDSCIRETSPAMEIEKLRNDTDHRYNQDALNALERVLCRSNAQLVSVPA